MRAEEGGMVAKWIEGLAYHSLYWSFHWAFQPSGTLGGGGPDGGMKSAMLMRANYDIRM